jgi:hypothetical protein
VRLLELIPGAAFELRPNRQADKRPPFPLLA